MEHFLWGSKTAMACLVAAAFGYGSFHAISESYRQYVQNEAWNKRGFIGCVDGHVEVRDIDINVAVSVIDVSEVDCSPPK